MTEGHFVTVRPDFGFVRPTDTDLNLYVSGTAMAALPRTPRRGDPVRFRIAVTRDGRRRALDLVLTDEGARE